jgi:NADH-quinone oxidoreductase subunit G
VLANLLGLEGFAYESCAEVLAELRAAAAGAVYDGRLVTARSVRTERRGTTTELPIYGVDAIVRRAPALQRTRAARGGTGREA